MSLDDAFRINGKELSIVHADTMKDAIYQAKAKGYRPLFMPELVNLILSNDSTVAHRLARGFLVTPSFMITIRTLLGSHKVAFLGGNDHFSKPVNIDRALRLGLQEGSARRPAELYEDLPWKIKLFGLTDLDKLEGIVTYTPGQAATMRHIHDFLGGKCQAREFLRTYSSNEVSLDVGNLRYDMPLARYIALKFSDNNKKLDLLCVGFNSEVRMVIGKRGE